VEARVEKDVRGRNVSDGTAADTKVWECWGITGVLLTVAGCTEGRGRNITAGQAKGKKMINFVQSEY
jgi:hypothetical protein